jgi:hypothetical protein
MKDVQDTGEAFRLKREHDLAYQTFKFLHMFLFLWVIFTLLDPDPDPADQNKCGS